MVVLEGEQDTGKTKACYILAGQWHSECMESMATKDFFQSLAGKWLVEVSELESFRRSSMERVKGAVSCRSDYFRDSYGRRATEHPRQCVLIGTTNAHEWMADESGGTRFLPIRCGAIDLEWLAQYRDQLLVEALVRYRRGEDWYTLPREQAAEQVESRYIADPWEEPIVNYCVGKQEVSVGELFGWLEIELERRDTRGSRRIGSVLRHLGWTPKCVKRDGNVSKVFTRMKSSPVTIEAEDEPPPF
jgi:predicted P-loop ATPase